MPSLPVPQRCILYIYIYNSRFRVGHTRTIVVVAPPAPTLSITIYIIYIYVYYVLCIIIIIQSIIVYIAAWLQIDANNRVPPTRCSLVHRRCYYYAFFVLLISSALVRIFRFITGYDGSGRGVLSLGLALCPVVRRRRRLCHRCYHRGSRSQNK